MWRRALVLVLLAALAFAADTQRLYLKDGTYQLTNQYEIQGDRVHYYSTERSEWEDIPLELIDLDRTKKEVAEVKAELDADKKARAEEDAAIRAAAKQVEQIPTEPGAYFIHGEKLEPIKLAESKIVSDKKRTVLKYLSPIPIVPGKSTLELDGETAAFKVEGTRPEFYFRESDYEAFAIVKLTPKKGFRVVEDLRILVLQGERMVDEERQEIKTFKKQEGDLLYKIWPEKPLEPGEYALMQYTDGKLDPQIWDFSVLK